MGRKNVFTHKLFVNSQFELLDYEKVKEILKECGIKRDFAFSHCFKKCVCRKNKAEFNIRFVTNQAIYYNLKDYFKYFIKLKFKEIKKIIYLKNVVGFYNIKEKSIFILPNRISEGRSPLCDTIKHEIRHIVSHVECERKKCMGFKRGYEFSFKKRKFCYSCQKEYEKALDIINGVENELER